MKNRLKEWMRKVCGVGCLVLLLCCANGGMKALQSGAQLAAQTPPSGRAAVLSGKALRLRITWTGAPVRRAQEGTAKRAGALDLLETLRAGALSWMDGVRPYARGKPVRLYISPIAVLSCCVEETQGVPFSRGADGTDGVAPVPSGMGSIAFTLELSIRGRTLAVQLALRHPALVFAGLLP